MATKTSEIFLDNYQEILIKIQNQITNTKSLIAYHKVEMAWNIGKVIDGYFLSHDEKIYGQELIENLSQEVGIDKGSLYKMRSFFKSYPQIPQDEDFSWSHYRILSGVKEDNKRLHYEKLVKEQSLNSKQLQQEVNKDKTSLNKQNEKVILSPSRGQIFNYEITKINGRGAFFLDLGFGVLRDVEDILPESLKITGEIVTINKVDKITKSGTNHKELHTYIAVLERVVDGDTIRVSLDLGFKTYEKQILRLAKINASELSTPEGKDARKELEKILAPYSYLIIKTLKTDIYGRYVADIFLPQTLKSIPQETANEGIYLNQKLLDLRLAEVY